MRLSDNTSVVGNISKCGMTVLSQTRDVVEVMFTVSDIKRYGIDTAYRVIRDKLDVGEIKFLMFSDWKDAGSFKSRTITWGYIDNVVCRIVKHSQDNRLYLYGKIHKNNGNNSSDNIESCSERFERFGIDTMIFEKGDSLEVLFNTAK